jgi:hypothetical protein
MLEFVNDLEAEMLNTTDQALLALSRSASNIQMKLRRKELVQEEELAALATLVADALGSFRLAGTVRRFQKDYQQEECS